MKWWKGGLLVVARDSMICFASRHGPLAALLAAPPWFCVGGRPGSAFFACCVSPRVRWVFCGAALTWGCLARFACVAGRCFFDAVSMGQVARRG